MNRETDSKRIPELDGIRGLAILQILLWHCVAGHLDMEKGWSISILKALNLAWPGVDLFFVLPGFLIGGIMPDQRNASNFLKGTSNNPVFHIIDADQNPDTGWYGYDYLINQRVVDDHTTTLERFAPSADGGSWVEVARLDYRDNGNALELAVPLKPLGLKGDAFSFDFHWCDHPADLKDPIALCTSGDSAPNRRFNYRHIRKNIGP